jgi:hypothetical protein
MEPAGRGARRVLMSSPRQVDRREMRS